MAKNVIVGFVVFALPDWNTVLAGRVYCSKVNIRPNTSVVVDGAESRLDGEGQNVLLEEQVVEGTKKTIRVNIELD